MSTAQITRAAVALPVEERRELVARLVESLPDEAADVPVDPALLRELRRRDEELRSGKTQGLTLEETMRRAREAVGCA